MAPTEDDIRSWNEIAKRRNAILPYNFQVLSKKEASITCGNCQSSFRRPLITAQNDPIYVCPSCAKRNYLPIDWNVVRVRRKRY